MAIPTKENGDDNSSFMSELPANIYGKMNWVGLVIDSNHVKASPAAAITVLCLVRRE